MNVISQGGPKCLLPVGNEPFLSYVAALTARFTWHRLHLVADRDHDQLAHWLTSCGPSLCPDLELIRSGMPPNPEPGGWIRDFLALAREENRPAVAIMASAVARVDFSRLLDCVLSDEPLAGMAVVPTREENATVFVSADGTVLWAYGTRAGVGLSSPPLSGEFAWCGASAGTFAFSRTAISELTIAGFTNLKTQAIPSLVLTGRLIAKPTLSRLHLINTPESYASACSAWQEIAQIAEHPVREPDVA